MRFDRAVAAVALLMLFTGCPKPKPGSDAGTDAGKADSGTDGGEAVVGCGWLEWGQNAAHGGTQCVPGQALEKTQVKFVYDPFVDQEIANDGALFVHYPSPLSVGDDVYMMFKSGNYVPCDPNTGELPDGGVKCGRNAWDQEVWTYQNLRWVNGTLTPEWTFWSDWTPTPTTIAKQWEPVFQAAIAGDFIYVPGKGGTVYKVRRADGTKVSQLNPFGDAVDATWFVAGGVTTTAAGDVLYNATKYVTDNEFNAETQAYLVKIAADGTITKVDYAVLVPDAPAATAQCLTTFNAMGANIDVRPWPPSPAAQPQTLNCGAQRPGVNISPAVGADGTIFTASHAHRGVNYSYMIAVNPDLTPKWHTAMRTLLPADGCGVLIPADIDANNHLPDGGLNPLPNHCRIGSNVGVDPNTNNPPAAQVSDFASSSPVALPDGTVVYGSFSGYNNSRGHLLKFSATGTFLKSFDFGWDVTPAYVAHDGTYSLMIKDNHYSWYTGGEYKAPVYNITRLSPELVPEWSFQSTNTEACERLGDGGMSCTTGDHNAGFEWCINAPAVDSRGVTYANSEDGWLYAINPDGTLQGRIFLESALSAAYTPLSIDDRGRIYTLNKGTMSVVGH